VQKLGMAFFLPNIAVSNFTIKIVLSRNDFCQGNNNNNNNNNMKIGITSAVLRTTLCI
jgi:hypothetical protein